MKASLEIIALQSLRHRIFYYAPKLHFSLQEKAHDMLQSFLCWAHEKDLAMDWTLHNCLLNWLCQEKEYLQFMDRAVIKELLIASVTRWSLSGLDHVKAKGILLTSRHLSGTGIGLWKSKKIDEVNKIVQIKLSKSMPDGYAISYVEGRWDKAKWVSMSC